MLSLFLINEEFKMMPKLADEYGWTCKKKLSTATEKSSLSLVVSLRWVYSISA